MDGATREERPPAVWMPPLGNARAEGGKWGEDKTGGVFFLQRSRTNYTDHSAPASATGACSVEAARSRSCEKASVGNILVTET